VISYISRDVVTPLIRLITFRVDNIFQPMSRLLTPLSVVPGRRMAPTPCSSLLLASLELSDKNVYEPYQDLPSNDTKTFSVPCRRMMSRLVQGEGLLIFFFVFFTLVTGPRRSLSLKQSDTRVYAPQTRARLGTNHASRPPSPGANTDQYIHAANLTTAGWRWGYLRLIDWRVTQL